jgi:hypothetical protein
MGILRAWTVAPRLSKPKIDHTYVTAHDDISDRAPPILIWDCFGRHSGGRLIAEVLDADIDAAQRVAGPDGTAGVRYGITGVAHQAANRILFAGTRTARQAAIVNHAAGYSLSATLFGAYGRGNWVRDQSSGTLKEELRQDDLDQLKDANPPILYVAEEPPPQVIEIRSTISTQLVEHLSSPW